MEKVILTGGTGFVGSWFVEELVRNGIEVYLLVRSIPKDPFFCNPLINAVLYDSKEYLNLRDRGPFDAFYHLAWSGTENAQKNNTELQLENLGFSLKLLEYATNMEARCFIATGTVAEYSFCRDVMDLSKKQTPNDMYGAAKTAVHYLLETRARMLKMPFIWAVLPSTYGERRKADNIVTYTILSLLRKEKPRYGNLEQMWDFLYAYDVARALLLIGEKGIQSKTYGVGSGVHKPLKDYIMTIRDLIDPNLALGIGEVASYSEKTFSSCVNIHELQTDTGFKPSVTFEEGIRRTIAYYRRRIYGE